MVVEETKVEMLLNEACFEPGMKIWNRRYDDRAFVEGIDKKLQAGETLTGNEMDLLDVVFRKYLDR